MEERGCGTILVTSATAAIRGNAGQHSHAAAMGGRRMLCQTLNAELGPKGIHVAHILVDGAVDAPDTLGRMLGPKNFEELRKKRGLENDGLIQPAKVADTYWHIAINIALPGHLKQISGHLMIARVGMIRIIRI